MSFLAGRLAGTEGAYFLQESKHAVGRLAQKLPSPPPPSSSSSSSSSSILERETNSDVLPEVLRHSLPWTIFKHPSPSDSSLSIASKWVLLSDRNPSSSLYRDAINPLSAFVSLPQVTFGPRRWQLPNEEHPILASTANDLRRDRYTHVDSKKLKAATEGLSRIGKAFAVATIIVFGGSTLTLVLTASTLQMNNSDDIKTKARDLLQPRFFMIREQLVPIRVWAENMSKKWHFEGGEGVKEKAIVRELSKMLGGKNH
eukprot:TRINITY_DN2346_c0_g4_i1.p1 TRINITY_DN2346_c0_g4~~TRINITY_DN2346_c0_g4_i1.p1  ORF type:complete len:257 (+),score=50.36 TRINITY_DN2346_c0_g4_i1:115-885(+)